ncbi:hypothetical protein V2J09_007705 [Rumex salicifolius]
MRDEKRRDVVVKEEKVGEIEEVYSASLLTWSLDRYLCARYDLDTCRAMRVMEDPDRSVV